MVNKDCKCKNCECKEQEAFDKTFEDSIPYTDSYFNETLIRKFPKETPAHLLKWHIDEEDRVIYPVEENDWYFQFDNKLPIPIDGKIEIPKGIEHRILKGTTDLLIVIEK